MPGRVAGTGVDTPRALASIASRWGARGDFGGRHVGDKVLGDVGDRRDWRGVSFMCNSFAAVDMIVRYLRPRREFLTPGGYRGVFAICSAETLILRVINEESRVG